MPKREDFSIYVAGASAEAERAAVAMQMLRDAGIKVTSTWVEEIKKSGPNPANASAEDRTHWAMTDLKQVSEATGLWLLMPVIPSMGAFFEFGCAHTLRMPVWVSGSNQFKSVFTALARFQHVSDENALKSIVRYSHQITGF